MKCFYHPAYDAVGLCKNCGKGLCPSCAVDLQGGLACKDQCEPAVEELIVMLRRGRTVYQKTDRTRKQYAVVCSLIGLTCVGFGLYVNLMIIWLMGLALCGFGLVSVAVKFAD